ncbi:unnamed protein product [Cylicocyclus nassatus]|uniref:MULE transposase domain-containing protein n=1 Tax=Cylicocyclus nassatus TaxID=53992 RepID=A0AA36DW23_CYLNA|nr:unnamed protein product [Cylicocyclus nassatus]
MYCAKVGYHTQVDVVDDEFAVDPCMLPHHCIPKKYKANYVQRFMYENLQKIRSDPNFEDAVVRKIWQDMLDALPLLRAVQSHDLPRTTLENQPDDLTKLDDGTQFLQLKLPSLYVYYSRKTIQKAVENELVALVADGIHKLPPEELGKDGQLYTIHGVCNGGIDVPLVHVLMKRKNQSVYDKVFRMVKEELVNYDVNLEHLRIVIDFERAVLASIRKLFPPQCVEGCGFHLAQAWNRKALSPGLKPSEKATNPGLVDGDKGTDFSPTPKKIPALFRPPLLRRDQPSSDHRRRALITLPELAVLKGRLPYAARQHQLGIENSSKLE